MFMAIESRVLAMRQIMPDAKTNTGSFSASCIILLAFAIGLILLMAFISQYNAHPDEDVHIEAAQYYTSHWIPPAVGAAGTEKSYSHFGISYLDELDIVYLLAGKFSGLLNFSGLPSFLRARAFNATLFVLLFFILLRASAEIRVPLYGMLLLSPQIWYVFSYFNNDAFAFFVGICLMVELFKFTENPERAWQAAKVGLWLGLLIVVKRNYYVLLPFVAAIAAWHTVFFCRVGQRRFLAKAWLRIILVAAIVGLPKIACQEWVNGFGLGEARVVHMERTAARGYKPSEASASYSPWYVRMRAKGYKPQELLLTYKWPLTCFKSMVGLYGWMDHLSPSFYYWVMFLLYILLFGRLCCPSLPFTFREVTLIIIAIFGTFALLTASFIQSWTGDYEAQGRYLFPVFCMFLFLLAYRWERLPKKLLYLGFLSVGILSLGNFSFLWS
jgi:hypothetical protein